LTIWMHDRSVLHFAELAVDAILRLKGNTDLSCIQIVKKVGGSMQDSYLEKGFVLDKKIGVGQPKRIENARILVANTALDTDKIKIFGARVRVDGVDKLAEIEQAEKDKMKKVRQQHTAHALALLPLYFFFLVFPPGVLMKRCLDLQSLPPRRSGEAQTAHGAGEDVDKYIH